MNELERMKKQMWITQLEKDIEFLEMKIALTGEKASILNSLDDKKKQLKAAKGVFEVPKTEIEKLKENKKGDDWVDAKTLVKNTQNKSAPTSMFKWLNDDTPVEKKSKPEPEPEEFF